MSLKLDYTWLRCWFHEGAVTVRKYKLFFLNRWDVLQATSWGWRKQPLRAFERRDRRFEAFDGDWEWDLDLTSRWLMIYENNSNWTKDKISLLILIEVKSENLKLWSMPVEQQSGSSVSKGGDQWLRPYYPVLKSGTLFGKIWFIVVVSGGCEVIIIGTIVKIVISSSRCPSHIYDSSPTQDPFQIDPVCVSNLLTVDCDLCLSIWLHFPYCYY